MQNKLTNIVGQKDRSVVLRAQLQFPYLTGLIKPTNVRYNCCSGGDDDYDDDDRCTYANTKAISLQVCWRDINQYAAPARYSVKGCTTGAGIEA